MRIPHACSRDRPPPADVPLGVPAHEPPLVHPPIARVFEERVNKSIAYTQTYTVPAKQRCNPDQDPSRHINLRALITEVPRQDKVQGRVNLVNGERFRAHRPSVVSKVQLPANHHRMLPPHLVLPKRDAFRSVHPPGMLLRYSPIALYSRLGTQQSRIINVGHPRSLSALQYAGILKILIQLVIDVSA
ncbi:MAG: hypothetical protein ACK56F_25490, partial [bacterium]